MPDGQGSADSITRLPPEALKLMRLTALFGVGVLATLWIAADVMLQTVGEVDAPWPPGAPGVLVGALLGALAFWWRGRAYRAWGYLLEPDRLRVERGVITTRTSILPRSRVQHVSSERGPVQRALGLVTLTVHTAGANTPNVEVPHLLVDSAEVLRRELIGDQE